MNHITHTIGGIGAGLLLVTATGCGPGEAARTAVMAGAVIGLPIYTLKS